MDFAPQAIWQARRKAKAARVQADLLTGDVTNAGLEVANSVVLAAGQGAVPVTPYREYVVGSLQPDDFSSFEVTCVAPGTSKIPLVVSYRDEDGKTFKQTFEISTQTYGNSTVSGSAPGAKAPQSMQSRRGGGFGLMGFGSGINKIPVIPIVVLIIAIIGGTVAWRKGYLDRLLDKIRERIRK